MKFSLVVLAFSAALAVVEVRASGWVDSGIAPNNPVSHVNPDEPIAFDYSFFEEEPNQVDCWSPIRVGIGWSKNSVTNNVLSLPWMWTDVYGLQAELLSCAGDVYGIQVCGAGAGNSVCGLQTSLGTYVYEDMYGCQVGLAFSMAKRATGLQVGVGCSMAEELCGIQLGGLASGARTSATGLQIAALVNTAAVCDGVQIGLFNFVESGTVLQIGLWNVYGREGSESRHYFPIVNAGW